MGTRKLWTEEMQAHFEEGTFASIAARFLGGEDRTDFVKAAVRNEMARRTQRRTPSRSYGALLLAEGL